MERRQEHINDGDNSMNWTEEDTGQRRILWTTLATLISVNQNKTENCSTIREKEGPGFIQSMGYVSESHWSMC